MEAEELDSERDNVRMRAKRREDVTFLFLKMEGRVPEPKARLLNK